MATLADLRTSVRSKLDDAQYEAASIDEAINWYVSDICSRVRLRIMETTEELFVSAGDYEVELPDDMQTLINLSAISPTPGRSIMRNYMEYGTFVGYNPDYQNATASAAATVNWTDYGGMMRLSAPASAASTLLCEYIRRPTYMEEDDDECDLPDAYNKMVVIGALAEIMERNEDYAEATQERNKLDLLETAFIRNESRGQLRTGPRIIRTNRGSVGGYRADRDF